QPAVESEVLKRIDVAERLGRPIGLAVIPSKEVVVIDFDRKNYPTQMALDEDWMRLLDHYPKLIETRIERTPSGGVHVYVRVMDRMASWKRPGGGLHCNFTTFIVRATRAGAFPDSGLAPRGQSVPTGKQLLYDWSHLICSVDSLVLIVVFGRATPACCLRPVMNPATLPFSRTWQ
ncbi:MAG: bifunctional DNA primase/polymerase, partial [Cyanobium sp.]